MTAVFIGTKAAITLYSYNHVGVHHCIEDLRLIEQLLEVKELGE